MGITEIKRIFGSIKGHANQQQMFKLFYLSLGILVVICAGAIFVNFNGSITPSQMTISYSITMVIWVAIGGRGTIIGAVIGAFLINLCEYNLSSGGMVEIWQQMILCWK